MPVLWSDLAAQRANPFGLSDFIKAGLMLQSQESNSTIFNASTPMNRSV